MNCEKMNFEIDFDNDTPLYHQIKEDLLLKIEQNKLKPGDKLPPEVHLMEKYDVSRITVRNAILALVNQGLLNRKSGVGTFVSQPKAVRPFPGVSSFTEDMRHKNMEPGRKLISYKIIEPSKSLKEKMELNDKEKVLQMERLMFADGEPIAIHFINLPELVWKRVDVSKENLKTESLYKLIESSGIILKEAEENIEGSIADASIAQTLGIKEGDPILIVERFVRTNTGEIMDYAINTYRADRYKYHIKHKRNKIENR
ncbi:MAG: GntR family transcriptional regulator [bacterium]